MGGMLTHPETEKSSDHGEGLGLRYGLSSMQGWRPEMEDAHDVKLGLRFGLDDWSFFAVFDGHAGKCTAAYAALNLLEYILRDSKFELETDAWSGPVQIGPNGERVNPSDDPNEGSNLQPGQSSKDVKSPKSESTPQKSDSNPPASKPDDESDNAVQIGDIAHSGPVVSDAKAKPDGDQNKRKSTFPSNPDCVQLYKVESAIRSGFMKMDQSMRSTAQDMSGCTAVCALISPTHLFIANCGDSRSVLANNGYVKFITEDHKPFNPRERKRIIAAGGTATQRVNGTLAVSRALGDFEFKKDATLDPWAQIVSPMPEVTVIERNLKDEFLILACDGIWDVINNDDLCEFVRYKLKLEPNLEKICSSVLDICLRKGSKDNMSIIIVVFENGPRVSEDEVLNDKNNEEELLRIANHVKDTNTNPGTDFSSFLTLLKDELWGHKEILPPGAGVEAKYDLLHDWFNSNFVQQENQENQEEIQNVG